MLGSLPQDRDPPYLGLRLYVIMAHGGKVGSKFSFPVCKDFLGEKIGQDNLFTLIFKLIHLMFYIRNFLFLLLNLFYDLTIIYD